jgi:alpha-1,2-mannosyltransferase
MKSAENGAAMERMRQALRSGDWLTLARIRMVAAAVLIASVAGFLFLVVTAKGGVDLQGRPIGTDFANVYAAGTYVLEGNPNAPFDSLSQYTREQAIFGASTQFYGWHYPPYFLFVAAPLALMPYGLALFVWQAVTLVLYLLAIGAILKAFAPDGEAGTNPLWLLLALAFPAVLINVGHGHNGFLTAALIGGGLVCLDRRPLVAGILFGLLVYKPQFGLMIPVALAAGGYWRPFISAAITVVVLTIVTTLTFGTSVWHAFLVGAEFTRTVVLEQGDTGWYKIQSIFSWARMWGAPVPIAYGIQLVVTLAIGVATAWLWRSKNAPFPVKAAALCLAAILATPYTLDYDMMVLAPAIAFLAADGFSRGFGPWQKTTVAALWLVPLFARTVPEATFIPLGAPVMLIALFMTLRYANDCSAAMTFADEAATSAPNRAGTVATTSPR